MMRVRRATPVPGAASRPSPPPRGLAARRALALLILASWAGIVGWHVRREYFKPELVRLAEGARVLGPGSHTYLVRMEGRPIGLASSRLEPDAAGGFTLEDRLTVEVPAGGRLQRAVARTSATLGPALELGAFEFLLDTELGRYHVEGAARGDVLEVRVGAGGDMERSAIPLERGISLPAALPFRVASAGQLVVGGAYRARVFDPSVMAGRDVEVRVTGRDRLAVVDSATWDAGARRWRPAKLDTVLAWRVEERYGGVRLESWIDGEGRLVRATTPMGFTIERTAAELAAAAWRDRTARAVADGAGYGPIIEATAIAADVPLRGGAPPERLAVRLLGADLDGFDLDGGRQRLAGDTLVVVRDRVPDGPASYRLPYSGGGEPAGALASTPLIQAEDPRIRATALGIAAGSDDPVEVARRLNDWVYRELEKEITLSLPSALQVLAARRGDCNEHTVLYVALARALGLPARTAVGLVHLDGFFYYHAWPEVWLGEWIAVDPTLGEFPAGATHLRFLVGGLARQLELIRLIGRLRLEVV